MPHPGITDIIPVKKTYLAQKSEVPGKPIVTRTPRVLTTHIRGALRAIPPM